MRRRLRINRETSDLVSDVKSAMHATVPPYELRVFQTLYDRARQDAFNKTAVYQFPAIWEKFERAIHDFSVTTVHPALSSRKIRNIARGAWKEDPGANRRIHELIASKRLTRRAIRHVNKGRPELYDRHVVWAFAYAIAKACGRDKFSVGHHGDKTITDEKKAGPMLKVLVAAMRWAMTIAWTGAAAHGVAPPLVKTEGILTLVKSGRPDD